MQFIESGTFIESSLSNLADDLAEGIYKVKCKNEHNDKKFEGFGIKYKGCECCLEHTNFQDDLILYKLLRCNNDYQKYTTR